jgi:hypothetical protein
VLRETSKGKNLGHLTHESEGNMTTMHDLLSVQIQATEAALVDAKGRLTEFASVNPLSGAALSAALAKFLDTLVGKTRKLTGKIKTAAEKAKPS